MKKAVLWMLACILALSPLTVIPAVAAETAAQTVYLSDHGDDSASGTDENAPVQTLEHAVELLGGAGAEGTVVITDSYTHTSAWAFPAAKRLTVTGLNGDSVFIQNRSNGVTVRSDLLFTNVNFKIGGTSNYRIYVNGFTVEFAEDVRVLPSDALHSGEKNYYPLIYTGGSSACRGGTLILRGGQYNYIVVGNYAGDVTGKTALTVGKNATVLGTVTVSTPGAFGAFDFVIDGTVKNKLEFKKGTATNYLGDGYLCVSRDAAIGGIAGLDLLSEGMAQGCTFTADFARSQAADTAFGDAVRANGFSVIPYLEHAPVFAGTQTRAGESRYDVRFCAALDTLEYENVGYVITASYGEGQTKRWEVNCRSVYTALTALENGSEVQITAEECGGTYLYALSVTGVPADAGAVTFAVTPYGVQSGETIVGNRFAVTCQPSGSEILVTCTYVG